VIDPAEVVTGLALTVLLVTGIEIGLAFLMRGQKETATDDD
jgi:hypothetical protein